jgi:SAM-dependent methyltransferase
MAMFILRAVRAFNSFAAVIMRPEEMVDYVKRVYNEENGDDFQAYSESEFVKRGLMPWEETVINKYVDKRDSFLVLGAGGGREAIALAKRGFKIVGIDSSELMIKAAKENAASEGVEVDFQTADLYDLPFPKKSFMYCLLSCLMYSAIPTRGMRIELLSKLRYILKDDGLLIIHFIFNPARKERVIKTKKFIARVFNGNLDYQPGDELIPPNHFLRHFKDKEEIASEAQEGGFSIKALSIEPCNEGHAILEKAIDLEG